MADMFPNFDIAEIVEVLEDKHAGGEVFFNALAPQLRCVDVYQDIHDLIKDPHRWVFLLTGAFGTRFLEWMTENSKDNGGYMLFPGGLRDGCVKTYTHFLIPDMDCWWNRAILIDACIYSGTTRATMIHNLYVSKQIPTYVAYDGMVEKQAWCHSLYRYHEEG